MTPKVGGYVWSVAGLTSLFWAGCGSDPPLCAEVGQQAPLPSDSPLALSRNAVLLRAGDGFVLAGLDGTTVRWGQLSSSGVLSGESDFELPETPVTITGEQALGPLFAVTSKTAPGDQLVVVTGVAGNTNEYEVHARVYDLGSKVPVTTQILGVQVAAANSGKVRLVAGSAPNGTRALVLWGVEGQLAPIHYQMLKTDGALVGGLGQIPGASSPNSIALWSCLDITQNAPNLAVTLIEAPNEANRHPLLPAWRRFDMNDDGSHGGETTIAVNLDVTDCRIVSTPNSDGYLLAWQNSSDKGGTDFAILTPAPPDAGPEVAPLVLTRPVLASASWGGYSQMPKLHWIAPAGDEFTIGLAGSRGPQVVRFDAYADPRGRTLYLPSMAGNTGLVSSWVGNDAVYVTYLDMPGSSTRADAAVPGGSQRYLVTVLSPAELP
jgi:hypothetical protein